MQVESVWIKWLEKMSQNEKVKVRVVAIIAELYFLFIFKELHLLLTHL